MNVLILEMGGSHIECIYTFVHFLKLQDHSVHLACNQKLLPLFPEQESLSGILPLNDHFTMTTSVKAFLSVRKYIRKHRIDALIINTTELKIIRNLSFFIPAKLNCTGLVHNAKKLEKSFTFTKILSRKIRKFFVLSDHLLQHIRPDPVFSVSVFYPVYFPQPKPAPVSKPADEYWITIPGEADESRRDYTALLKEIEKDPPDPSVKFIFLGKFRLAEAIDVSWMASDWWQQHIVHFGEQVEYDTFHHYIQQTDILLPLIRLQDDRMYGNSRVSGSFNLGLGYRKPFLLPQSLQPNADLQPYSMYYSSMTELMNLVAQFKRSLCRQEEIQAAYATGPFNDISRMGDDVCSFIFKKA